MQRPALAALAATLAFAAASALAQGGSLAGVTMRVLDDISGIDADVLELDVIRPGDESSPADGPQATAPADEATETAPDEPTDGEQEPRKDADELREDGTETTAAAFRK